MAEIAKEILFFKSEEQFEIDIEKLRSYDQFKYILYYLLKDCGFTAWNDIYELLNAQTGKFVSSATHRISKNRKFLVINTTKGMITTFETVSIQPEQIHIALDKGELRFEKVAQFEQPKRNEIYVDRDKLQYPLKVGKPRKGDHFYPLGMKGKKKVSKCFKDEKLSLPQKENTWLLYSGTDQVVWVINYRADDRFKITNETTNCIKISYHE